MSTELLENSTITPRFRWNEQRSQAALSLAEGKTKQEVADEAGVDRTTVYLWLKHPDFCEEIDRLSVMIGVASRAERLRLAQRVIRQKIKEDGTILTDRDLLEWLKFAQSETDGVRLDLGKLAAALGTDEASLAAGRQDSASTGRKTETETVN